MFGTVKMDFVKMEVVRDHVQIPLTVKEFRVLEFIIKNACCRPISGDETSEQGLGIRVPFLHPHRGQSHPQASTEIGERSR